MKEKFVVNAIRQLVLDNQAGICELVNFLVHANSMEQAQELVEKYLQANQHEQTNSSGQTFFWKFIEVESVNPIIFEGDEISELQVRSYSSLEKLHQSIS